MPPSLHSTRLRNTQVTLWSKPLGFEVRFALRAPVRSSITTHLTHSERTSMRAGGMMSIHNSWTRSHTRIAFGQSTPDFLWNLRRAAPRWNQEDLRKIASAGPKTCKRPGTAPRPKTRIKGWWLDRCVTTLQCTQTCFSWYHRVWTFYLLMCHIKTINWLNTHVRNHQYFNNNPKHGFCPCLQIKSWI